MLRNIRRIFKIIGIWELLSEPVLILLKKIKMQFKIIGRIISTKKTMKRVGFIEFMRLRWYIAGFEEPMNIWRVAKLMVKRDMYYTPYG